MKTAIATINRPVTYRYEPADSVVAEATRFKAERDARAAAEFAGYDFLYLPGSDRPQGVVKIADGTPYLMEVDREGVTVCMCPDGHRVEAMNNRLRAAGSTLRVTCKHRMIRYHLERAAWKAGKDIRK